MERIFDAEKIIAQPLAHISQKGTDRNNIMSRIWRAFNFWFDCLRDQRVKMAEMMEVLHSTANMMDDIIDNTSFRRGAPSAHVIFGNPHAIYGVIYAMNVALEKVFEFIEHKEILTDEFIDLGYDTQKNQTMILYHKDNLICPTYEEFVTYLCSKAYLSFSVKLLQVYGRNKLPDFNLVSYEKLGAFVQIYNDYVNIQSSKYTSMRSYCDDVTEGKFTFLVIHAVRSHPEDKRILEIIKKRPSDIESKRRYVSILKELGSVEFTKNTLKKLRDESLEEMEKLYLKRNPYMEKPLDDILKNLHTDGDIYFEMWEDPKKYN